MNAKHTPGPWIVSRNQICTADRKAGIGTVSSGSIDFKDGEVDANAALIAAAPDLLAALEVCERVLSDLPSTHKEGTRTRTAYDLARDAIAKSTGSQA